MGAAAAVGVVGSVGVALAVRVGPGVVVFAIAAVGVDDWTGLGVGGSVASGRLVGVGKGTLTALGPT